MKIGDNMAGKRLGVLGGMGPEATSIFFNKLVKNTVANSDQEHINTIILNHATIPDRTQVIIEDKGEDFLKAVKEDFLLFERAEVDHIAIPCNTSHYFFEEMQGMTPIKIINMIDETIKELRYQLGEHKKVAILATDGTIRTKIYEKACEKFNLIPYKPKSSIQSNVMEIIYQVKQGVHVQPAKLENIIYKMIDLGCSAVILGCTELSTLPIDPSVKLKTIDPLEVLVHQSIILSDKQSKLTFEIK